MKTIECYRIGCYITQNQVVATSCWFESGQGHQRHDGVGRRRRQIRRPACGHVPGGCERGLRSPTEKQMILRRCFAFVAVLVGINTTALAETWPTRPIKAFIPFSAGSATDVIPRVVFEELSTQLGQPIVVENRGGAGGTIGVGAVVAAAPDGYTILANSSAHTIAPWIVPNLPYNVATDLRAAVALGKNANVLVVSPSKGWRTLQDLVAAAKAKPGTFNYGSAGVGTATHISAERLRLSARFEATHIPYKGGPEALADVLAGRVD